MWRRILAAFGAASAILLALTRVGVTPIAPGVDTAFHAVRECPLPHLMCFETDAGNLTAFVTLTVRTASAASRTWHAGLNDGTRLAVEPRLVRPGVWRLAIYKPDSTLRYAKFPWGSGVVLQVTADRRERLALQDWRIHSDRGGDDTKARASWRKVWSWISITLILIGVAAAAAQHLRKPPEELTAEELLAKLVRITINEIEADSEAETQAVRSLLTLVLFGSVPVGEVLGKMSSGDSPSRRLARWFKARSLFIAHFNKLLRRMRHYLDLLND